jgi:hypothetical protein
MRVAGNVLTVMPGMVPGAPKRNALVGLVYVLVVLVVGIRL